MRRRKPSGGDDDDTLHARLLGGEPSHGSSPGVTHHALGDLFGALHDFLLRLLTHFGLLPPSASPSAPLTETQKLRFAKLAARVDVPYDGHDGSHVEQLTELWRVTFPELPPPIADSETGSLKHEGWKAMGWQGLDPSTDFRSGGLLSLHNLLWFAKHAPETYERILHKTTGHRSDWEYPFAAAGVNITFALISLLQLRGKEKRTVGQAGVVARDDGSSTGNTRTGNNQNLSHVPSSPAAIAFLDLLDPGMKLGRERSDEGENDDDGEKINQANPECAFENLYVLFWRVFDNEWLDRKATYMEFSSVMASCVDRMRSALEREGKERGGCTIEGLRETLGLEPAA